MTEQKSEERSAKKVQKIDNGINSQTRVFEIGAAGWSKILADTNARKSLTPKEIGILQIAAQIPGKIPTERQCGVLIDIWQRVSE